MILQTITKDQLAGFKDFTIYILSGLKTEDFKVLDDYLSRKMPPDCKKWFLWDFQTTSYCFLLTSVEVDKVVQALTDYHRYWEVIKKGTQLHKVTYREFQKIGLASVLKKKKAKLIRGSIVRIIKGSFFGWVGSVQKVNGEEVEVGLCLFGKITVVIFKIDEIELCK